MMFQFNVPTKRGPVLNGVLFRPEENRSADTVMIAITGIHGNFYSNPFYYNIGDTLNSDNIDFIYAQTNDAFGQMETVNVNSGKKEIIGSWNERFSYADEDIDAYLSFAE
ncbi:alpha/beta hydrolase [Megasphaera elsdenii]|uniref:alpha/beta hydrolase n=1 Tax=Megasphaera elsdenii TaxID=907 RepID=UPI0039F48D66